MAEEAKWWFDEAMRYRNDFRVEVQKRLAVEAELKAFKEEMKKQKAT